MEEIKELKDSSTIMQSALHEKLDMKDLSAKLSKMDANFETAKVNSEATFAMWLNAVNEYLELTAMALFRAANDL